MMILHKYWEIQTTIRDLKGRVTAAQLLLFNFANYSPSIAMRLKVSKEITCK